MINNQNIGVLSEKVSRLESDVKTLALPSVTSSDVGKSLIVNSSGAWKAANIDADDVIYSEGVSVKDKIDDVESSTAWKWVGDATGTSEINLPQTWKELLIQITSNNANLVTYHIYSTQTESYANTSFGSYGTSYAVGSISRTKAKINTVNWSGQDDTSSAKMYIYYR